VNRTLLGALAALLLVAAGVFWWQGRAETSTGTPPPDATAHGIADPNALPSADGRGLRGAALPEADEMSREQRRFDRFDRDRDGRITRNELLAPRADSFRKLDTDHNNLLSFEEWAVKTGNRFKGADSNGDGALTRPEFATTKPKLGQQPQCNCRPQRQAASQHSGHSRRSNQPNIPTPSGDVSDGIGDDPVI